MNRELTGRVVREDLSRTRRGCGVKVESSIET